MIWGDDEEQRRQSAKCMGRVAPMFEQGLGKGALIRPFAYFECKPQLQEHLQHKLQRAALRQAVLRQLGRDWVLGSVKGSVLRACVGNYGATGLEPCMWNGRKTPESADG